MEFDKEMIERACELMVQHTKRTIGYNNNFMIDAFELCGIDTSSAGFNTAIVWSKMRWSKRERAGENFQDYMIDHICEWTSLLGIEQNTGAELAQKIKAFIKTDEEELQARLDWQDQQMEY
jgi:hypothetical protein